MPAPSKHLLVVTPTFHPEPIGTPLYVTDLCRWFLEHGWTVHVVTSQPYYPLFRRYDGYGRRRRRDFLQAIEITRLPTVVPRQGRHAWRAVSDLNFLLQGIGRATSVPKAACVLSISPGTPWAALVGTALAGRKTRHVCFVHDVQSGLAHATSIGSRPLTRLIRSWERRSLNTADNIVAPTSNMVEFLRRSGVTSQLEVLPLWSTVQSPREFPSLSPEIQYSGNFGEKQGVDQLPELAAALGEYGVPLRIRGAGPRFESLAPEIAGAAEGLVTVDPLAEEAELSSALAESPVHVVLQAPGTGPYVMPSKIINALTCGATVVAMADEDSPVERLARRSTGLHVVPTRRVDLMVQTICEVMPAACDGARRKAIADAAAAAFSRDNVLHQLESILLRPYDGEVRSGLLRGRSDG